MNTSDDALARHFRELGDAELLRRLSSDDLTDEARNAANAERQLRNIDVAAARVDTDAQVSEDSSRKSWTPLLEKLSRPVIDVADAAPRKLSVVWWLYFGYLVAMITLGLIGYALSFRHATALVLEVLTVTTLLDAVACVGIWGYLRAQRIGPQWLWAVVVLLKFLQFAVGPGLMIWAKGRLTMSELAGLVLGIPLLIALWRYAFRSPRLWLRDAAP